jgi:RNA polymerase sigma-70 factor, ECF subfamily
MVRLAASYLPSRQDAEEVAQETWQGVLEGLHRFEGRASLKTWIFRILINRAMTRGAREKKSVPFSAMLGRGGSAETEDSEPAVPFDRFSSDGPQRGHWVSMPRDWGSLPEERVLSGEIRAMIKVTIDALPPAQRAAILLRDVEGMASSEVCELLAVSESNQRVLLHRARSRVRLALEEYMGSE